MATKEERAILGGIILGILGYYSYGQNAMVIGAIVGAVIGYFWGHLRK